MPEEWLTEASYNGAVFRQIALLLLAAAPLAGSETWTGKVVGVHDGDTITVLRERTPVKIRLAGVDCPESAQPFGERAKQKTSELVFGKTVTVRPATTDRYGRSVAWIGLPDGRDLSKELLKAGLAWWFRRYNPKDRTLAGLEEDARQRRLGLWADDNPIPPWLWRETARAPR